jgi:hypothetical protein
MLAPAEPIAPVLEFNITRAQDLEKVQKVLEAKVVKQRLEDLGLSAEEAGAKLDRLSDAQLHQLAMQIDSLLPGGTDGTVWTIVGILLIVVLVILLATLL